MKLTLRTVLVLIIGAVVAFLLYIAADLAFGSGVSLGETNSNFSAVIGAWQALGGRAGRLDAGGPGGEGGFGGQGGFGGPEGFGPAPGEGAPPPDAPGFGDGGLRRGHRGGGLGEGANLGAGLAQLGSDFVWIGIPALLGGAIEIVIWRSRRRRPNASRPSGASA